MQRSIQCAIIVLASAALAACSDNQLPTEATKAALLTPRMAVNTITAVQISAGPRHTCALKNDGTLVCWGSSLGVFSSDRVPMPTGTFTQVNAGGDQHACALRTDATVACWGDNDFGQSVTAEGTFLQVVAGGGHTCGLHTDNTVECWGYNEFDQALQPSGPHTQVSAGGTHSCAIRANATLRCWGDLGDGISSLLSNVTQIEGGAGHECAIIGVSTAFCWGWNDDGQASAPSGAFSQISAGRFHSCAVRTNGTIACWGDNLRGRATPPPGTFVQVTAGWEHTCAITTDGHVVCWGDNSIAGQLNVPPELAPPAPTTTSLTSTPNPSAFGQTASFTATVTKTDGGAAVTTGTVTFIDGGTCAAPTTTLASNVALNGSGAAAYSTGTLAIGTHAISACYGGTETLLESEGSTSHKVDPAVTVTTLTVSPATQQYSDRVTLTAAVSPSNVNGSLATGSVQFTIDAGNVGSPVALGAGGTATISALQITLTPGSHTVGAVYTSTSGNYKGSTASTVSLTVTAEDAGIVYAAANPVALQVSSAGGALNTNALTFAIGVKEHDPDAAVTPGTTGIGNIANAGLAVALAPVGPGISHTLACAVTGIAGTGYNATRNFTCTNSAAIAVNVYEVQVTVTGGFYVGDYDDALTVFDPSLGFVTGGGSFLIDGDRARFGINTKYKKNGDNAKGDLLVVRRHADGRTSILKSTALGGMAVGEDPTVPMGWAALSGKSTYTSSPPGSTTKDQNTVGGQSFTLYVEDRGSPGNGKDRVWIGGPANLTLPGTATSARANAIDLIGGNVVVPHRGP